MKKGNNIMSKLITIKKFAENLGKSEQTVRTWKHRKELPEEIFIKIGGCIFVNEDRWNDWVENAS